MPDRLPSTMRAATRHALFLDFDGTLVDIAPRPDAIVVHPELSAILCLLRERLDGALAIVTGRPVHVIDEEFAPERFDVAGLHGAETRLANAELDAAPADPALRRSVERLRGEIEGRKGLLLEDKGRSFALHWRLAPALADEANALMQAEAARLGPAFRLQSGKSVMELLPASATKGGAIQALMKRPPYLGRVPVFIGDDVTDEHGFAVVDEAGGVSVRVGEGPSRAACRISTPSALMRCLERWAQTGDVSFLKDEVS
jgi:trehalose 6-phosphate phosphatase